VLEIGVVRVCLIPLASTAAATVSPLGTLNGLPFMKIDTRFSGLLSRRLNMVYGQLFMQL
jgi:hypothetical protein